MSKLSLFKNGIGRPSNETIRKRKIIYSVLGVIALTVVVGAAYLLTNGFIAPIIGGDKNAVRRYRVNFYANGAKVSKSTVYCTPKAGVCQVTAPTIKRSGYKIIGWGTEGSATNAVFQPGQKINVYKNASYYAITKKTYTATFQSSGLEYIKHKKLTCNVYNKDKNCTIILPKYEKQGVYNSYWSSVKLPSTNLSGKTWKSAYFNSVLSTYKLTKDTTFYPNFNPTSHKDKKGKIAHDVKYKNLKIHSTENIGKTTFEFESGISNYVINDHVNSLKKVYKQMPWMFNNGKIFVVTEKTYDINAASDMYVMQKINNNYFVAEMMEGSYILDDSSILFVLADVWDNYYYGTFGSHIYELNNFNNFYNKLINNKTIDKTTSKAEWFEYMVVNYYRIILKNDPDGYWNVNKELSYSEEKTLKKLIEEYAAL